MAGAAEYLAKLDAMQVLRGGLLRRLLVALELPHGSRGLDVGCGMGGQTLLAAEIVGPDGMVWGLDQQALLVEEAARRAQGSGLGRRTAWLRGDARALPFADQSLDWAMSIDCVGYGSADWRRAMSEMARVVRPGGLVALAAWSGQVLLPGHADLERRLDATAGGMAPYNAADWRDHRFLDRGHDLCRAGLREPQGLTMGEVFHGPLGTESINALRELVAMRWPGAQAVLGGTAAACFARLMDPLDGEFIFGRRDYRCMINYALAWARRP